MPNIVLTAAPSLLIVERPAATANYSRTRRRPSLIVLHSTEGGEGAGATDANVAAGIATPKPQGQRTSFHYVVDADSASRCVPAELTAWHCGKTGNARGIGVEICGRASQTPEQWLDANSLPTLRNAARLVAQLCEEWQIPPVFVSSPELHAGHSGITTHAVVSVTWRESTHTDPGPYFPLNEFLEAVTNAVLEHADGPRS